MFAIDIVDCCLNKSMRTISVALLVILCAAPAVAVEKTALGKMPVHFEPNRGQAPASTLFLTRDRGLQAHFTSSGALFRLEGSEGAATVQMKWLGAHAQPVIEGEDRQTGYSNFLMGRDPKQWKTNVPHYSRLRYRGVYRGTDLVFYSKDGRFEYDFILAPGADPGQVKLQFDGVDKAQVNRDGDLELRLAGKVIYQRRPVAYQMIDGARRPVTVTYAVNGGLVSLRTGDYDRAKELVIDPVLTFSTFLGGSAGDRGAGIAVDPAGNIYVAGATSSTNFVTSSPYQNTLRSGRDVFVTKLNNNGTSILYSTYIGGAFGSGGFGNDWATDIAVDAGGNAYVAGTTDSGNFPTTPGAFRTTYSGTFGDGFILKLHPQGNSLVYSTYLGGSDTDEIFGISIDAAGAAYVAGYTKSANFPTAFAMQGSRSGTTDAFAAKLNPAGSALEYSTYLGGSGEDRGFDVAVDTTGSAYITGETESSDFPRATAFQNQKGASKDAFLTKLQPNGQLSYSTYLGGGGADQGFAVVVDTAGNAYVAGETASNDFPRHNAYQNTFGGFSDAFVTKFNSAGSALVYSTYIGGSLTDGAFALAVDAAGQAHITGRAWSSNFPLLDAFQTTYGGSFNDGFVTKLNANGSALIYSSYLGGANDDNADNSAGFLGVGGVAIDSAGAAYYTGRTDSNNFPTTNGVVQTAFGGRSFSVGDDNVGDAFVVKIGGSGSGGNGIPSNGLRFVPLTPCRLIETRAAYNFENRAGAFGPPHLQAGETRTFLPSASNVCAIPASAKAYVFNVTLIPRGAVDFVTVFPGGESRPPFWTVRSPDGQIVANSAIVKAGVSGVSIYASHDADMLVDISGYFTDAIAGTNLVFYPLSPCRVIETRAPYRSPPGPFGPPSMNAQETRSFIFPSSPHCTIPAGAVAYSVTVTVVPPAPLAYLTAWPAGGPQPNVSNINSFVGRVLANNVIVPANNAGAINVFVSNATDFIMDINGYFAPDDGVNGQYYFPLTQCRVSDSSDPTYTGVYGGPMYGDNTTRTLPVREATKCASSAQIPASAKGYVVNVTAMPGGSPMPFITAYPTGQGRPNASILNAFEGQTVTNSAIIGAGTNGAIDVYAFQHTHIAVELAGYFGR